MWKFMRSTWARWRVVRRRRRADRNLIEVFRQLDDRLLKDMPRWPRSPGDPWP
jgi:hypothetical protein